MKDKRFRKQIDDGEVVFSAGSVIECVLVEHIKESESGDEIVTGRTVETVVSYTDEHGETVTPQGRKQRRLSESQRSQRTLDF